MSSIVALVVAALHVGFMVLESILWTKPLGRKIFKLSEEKAQTTKDLASNQGIYNLMVAVGIAWAVGVGNAGALAFLLVFVVVVGIYGAVTVSPAIVVVQSLPAAIALGLQQLGL
jgi:putative membrane protein